jgi:hypothetical protein
VTSAPASACWQDANKKYTPRSDGEVATHSSPPSVGDEARDVPLLEIGSQQRARQRLADRSAPTAPLRIRHSPAAELCVPAPGLPELGLEPPPQAATARNAGANRITARLHITNV